MINSGFSGPFAVFGSIGSSLTSGDFLAIDVSKDTPSTCLSLRLCMLLSAAAAARSFSRCSRCSMRSRFLTSACSLCLLASSFALAYALSLPAFTPFNADFPVMITRQMIIRITVTTYVPATPIAGVNTDASPFPIFPPSSSTSCSKISARNSKSTAITVFMYAYRLPLLDTRKDTRPNKTNGMI